MLHVPHADFVQLARDALSHALNIALRTPPPSPNRLFTPLRVSGGGATTLRHRAVNHGPEHVPRFLLLLTSNGDTDRHSVRIAWQNA